jgi:uncharacterized protein (TIGR02117 family)
VPVLILLALVLGIVLPRPPAGTASGAGPAETTILVLAGSIHTDIALPLDARTLDRFAFAEAAGVPLRDPRARWLVIGWGGRAFYLETRTWAELRPGPVLRALTLDASALHVDVATEVSLDQPGVLPLRLSGSGRAALEDAILATFARSDGQPRPIPGEGYGWSDRFFEARGRFNLLLGCNTWTAAMLREAGLTTGWWTPLPSTLLASLRLHNEPLAAPSPS